MKSSFGDMVRQVIERSGEGRPLSGFVASDQFDPGERGDEAVARNLNAAFLIALSGPGHPRHEQAVQYLDLLEKGRRWARIASFYAGGLLRIGREISGAYETGRTFRDAFERAVSVDKPSGGSSGSTLLERVWQVFFPEGAWCLRDHEKRIMELRRRRLVRIDRFNPDPVTRPARQILFLSNLLITVPDEQDDIDALPYSPGILKELKRIVTERQKYWFDHPIQIGVKDEQNEAIYGLRGLDHMMAFEKFRGVIGSDEKLTCLLSVSVTHDGLHRIVKDYLREVYAGTDPFPHLRVYLFSEVDTERIVERIILPSAKRYLGVSSGDPLKKVFGVDGEYGRHYSFLKAMSAFWQVLVDPGVKGSFKIDMDQVFDEDALIAETGQSALEHFLTPLWGAEGTDADGRSVELGMMAGALVNESDIHHSLFTPDVPIPREIPGGEGAVFYSPLAMALSTRAEMMARYDSPPLDGLKTCIQRIHVTGGTCAALIRSIRRHRPFTPTFVGRAEDQAYLLSCLFSDGGGSLRYVHKPGLIMRHDKEAFAGQAIRGAGLGKYVGDLVRILLFSYYTRALPWAQPEIKRLIDPFTGCFASRIPLTLVYLRLALKLMEIFASGKPSEMGEGLKLLNLAVDRLEGLMRDLTRAPNPLIHRYGEEKEGWDMFYQVLDCLEEALAQDDAFAGGLKKRAGELVGGCLIDPGNQQ
ncbi:MAG: hypothetical protein JRJ71_00775 [Deltaproteobacteria bacterium]|nr:hypothetical protein [Deltaproteobacteria bacterium]